MIRPFGSSLTTKQSLRAFSRRQGLACHPGRPFRGIDACRRSFSFAALTNVRPTEWIVSNNHTRASKNFSSEATAVDEYDASRTLSDATTTTFRRKHLRAVAIIAHVDHGKTTLVDELLKAAERSRNRSKQGMTTTTTTTNLNRLMDSGELEKERGITITSKVTRLEYQTAHDNVNHILNIVDTPGHSDFCGEVDRVLSVRGVWLVLGTILSISLTKLLFPQLRWSTEFVW